MLVIGTVTVLRHRHDRGFDRGLCEGRLRAPPPRRRWLLALAAGWRSSRCLDAGGPWIANHSTNPYTDRRQTAYRDLSCVIPALLAVLVQWGLVRRRWLRAAGEDDLARWPWVTTAVAGLTILNPIGLAVAWSAFNPSPAEMMWALFAAVAAAVAAALVVMAAIECYIRGASCAAAGSTSPSRRRSDAAGPARERQCHGKPPNPASAPRSLVYFPMFIATLSLMTSIYNGYLNSKFVDFIQRNAGRTEYLRTCKEIIDAYFQVKMRIGVLNGAGAQAPAPAQTEAANAVAKVGALGTYLANLRDETTRERYTRLTTLLEGLVQDAPRLSAAELDKRTEAADREFSEMNADCVKSAKELPR